MTGNGQGLRIGVDIGGTFTDLLNLDPERGTFHVGKTLTTPDNHNRAVTEGFLMRSAQPG